LAVRSWPETHHKDGVKAEGILDFPTVTPGDFGRGSGKLVQTKKEDGV